MDLSQYVMVGRYDLPEPTRTTAPTGNLLAQEASNVTYNWDTNTLFITGDGGTAVVQVNLTGELINTMTLAPGTSPQGTEFYDTEGLTYIGNGQFVMTEERYRQIDKFTYVAGTTLTFTTASADNWTIDAKAGNDTVTTGAGADLFYAGIGNDTFSSGGGNDTFVFSGNTGGFDNIDGGSGTDTITVNANNAKIGLTGISNVEAISAGAFTGVSVVGSGGADSLDFTGVTLTGIVAINGGLGADQIVGSAGADRIIGAAGADILSGGDGADVFAYNTVADSGIGVKADHILDFVAGLDKIDLSAIDAVGNVAGKQTFTFIGTDDFTALGQVRVGTSGGHIVVQANISGNTAADFSIVLDNNPLLTASDFIFI